METKQPMWEFIANLGDMSPLDYGGYFVYVDATGIYDPQAVLLEEPNEGRTYTVYRFDLEQLKRVETPERILLVPFAYAADWTHPVEAYDAWFSKDLTGVAESGGIDLTKLRGMLCSNDATTLARAYQYIGEYHGWDNFDSYPETMTQAEVKRRYKVEVSRTNEIYEMAIDRH